MTALRAAAVEVERRRTPLISPAGYDRSPELSQRERRALRSIDGRPTRWPAGVAQDLARLTLPINDVLAVAGRARPPFAVRRHRSRDL
jgi:hypothetical protein